MFNILPRGHHKRGVDGWFARRGDSYLYLPGTVHAEGDAGDVLAVCLGMLLTTEVLRPMSA